MKNSLARYRKWYEDGIISYNTYCQKCQEILKELMRENQNVLKRLKENDYKKELNNYVK